MKLAALFPGIGYTCAEQGIPLCLTEGANHSLETGDLRADLAALAATVDLVEAFIEQCRTE